MFSEAVNLYYNYIGSGMMAGLMLISLVFLYVNEKKKYVRILLVFMPIASFAMFFFPYLGKAVNKYVGSQIYFRFIWMVPTTLIIAYAMVKFLNMQKGRAKLLVAVAAVIILMLSGKLIYTSGEYALAENEYHLPQEVIDICDEIIIPGREVMAAFPPEMICYVRQYNTCICMPYGRASYMGEIQSDLYDICTAPVFNFSDFGRVNLDEGTYCHYVILDENKLVTGDIENYGYEYYKTIDGYAIFRNKYQYYGYDYTIE